MPQDQILLSVLVPGIPERWECGGILLGSIHLQAKDKPVEILYLMDNLHMSVGRKRNILLSIAQGEYVSQVDDDDSVAGDYVDTLLAAIHQVRGVDVIVFNQDCVHADSGLIERCKYGLGFQYATGPIEGKPNERWWTGLPAHTACWRTDLVQDVEFPDGSFGEDSAWVKKAAEWATTEHRIERVLYTYHFDPSKSRTRGR
jgi:hypothetical protein